MDRDAGRDEVAVDDELAQPRHKAEGEHAEQGEQGGAQVARQRRGQEQKQRGDAREGAEAAVDEFNPGVGGVEGGVVVFEVRLPLTPGAFHVEVAGHEGRLGNPQGVVVDEHAVLVVMRTRRPRHLRGFGGGHKQPKALGPVWTTHTRFCNSNY